MQTKILPSQKIWNVLNYFRTASGLTIVVLIAMAIIVTIDKGPYVLINTIITGGMWALISMGLALIFGVMNISNFAHGEFFMIGGLVAYLTLKRLLGISSNNTFTILVPFISFLIATIIGGLAGGLIERSVFSPLRKRKRREWVMDTFLLTVGLSVTLINLHQLLFGVTFKGFPSFWKADPIHLFGVAMSWERLVAFIIGILAILLFWFMMKYSRIGQSIRAVSQDELGAMMVGINLNRIHTITMALASSLAALAGACLLFMFPSYPTAGTTPLFTAWFVVIVVGLGNVSGAMIGGFIVAFLQVLTATYVGEGWGFVIPCFIIIVILIVKPSGIFGSAVKGIQER